MPVVAGLDRWELMGVAILRNGLTPRPAGQKRKKELANRLLIREHAFSELLDPDKLERLSRYEVHLDRKLERTSQSFHRGGGSRLIRHGLCLGRRWSSCDER